MKKVKIKTWLGRTKATVMLYDSIKELPIDRYQEFEKMIMIDLGVGSNMEDVGGHFSRLYQFIESGDVANINKIARNIHNAFYFILTNFNTSFMSFLALVHSVNGKEVNISDPERVRHQIQGLTQGQVTDITEEVKKKLIQKFEPCFLIEMTIAAQLTSQQA